MKRLLEIDAKCNPDRQTELQASSDNVDKFTARKRELASLVKEIRTDIQNRDEARTRESNADLAKRGFEIRNKIKIAEELGDELEQIHKKKNNKLTMPGKEDEKRKSSENRQAVIELMHQHLKQVKLEQAKTGREVDDSISSIDGGDYQGDQVLMQMDLQAIDDPDFDRIKENERKIDEGLQDLHEGVKRLRQLALEVGDILVEQEEELDRLNELAETVNEELKSANHLLGKVVKDVKSPAMLCCDCILCLMVIGIAVGLYFALTN